MEVRLSLDLPAVLTFGSYLKTSVGLSISNKTCNGAETDERVFVQ